MKRFNIWAVIAIIALVISFDNLIDFFSTHTISQSEIGTALTLNVLFFGQMAYKYLVLYPKDK